MFRQPASRSLTSRDLFGDLSPDQSSCSSDTGDVLIRATTVHLPDRRHEAGPGPGSVQLTVQKLRDPVPVRPTPAEQQRRRPKLRQKPNTGATPRSATDCRPDQPGPTKENREPTGTPPAAEWSPDRKLSAGTLSDRQPGHDLLTSRFTAGGRGVVLAALKQRSHSAPHGRDVKVKLLDPGPRQTSSQEAPGLRSSSQDAADVAGVQVEAGLSSGCPGDATSAAAAAAAAAVAAAAPLIKAQSDMEARMSQLVDGVQQLLQADRQGGDRGRSLSQQTLQHLETLHSQQLQLQSQLLESALRIVTGHAPMTSTTSDLTASGQPAHLQVTHLDSAVLGNQQHSSSATRAAAVAAATTAVETGPVAMVTPTRDRWPEQTSATRSSRRNNNLRRAEESLQPAWPSSSPASLLCLCGENRAGVSGSAEEGGGRRAGKDVLPAGLLVPQTVVLPVRPAPHALGHDLGLHRARLPGLRQLRGRGPDRVRHRDGPTPEAGSRVPGGQIPGRRSAASAAAAARRGEEPGGVTDREGAGGAAQPPPPGGRTGEVSAARFGPVRARDGQPGPVRLQRTQAAERTRGTEWVQTGRRPARAEPTEPELEEQDPRGAGVGTGTDECAAEPDASDPAERTGPAGHGEQSRPAGLHGRRVPARAGGAVRAGGEAARLGVQHGPGPGAEGEAAERGGSGRAQRVSPEPAGGLGREAEGGAGHAARPVRLHPVRRPLQEGPRAGREGVRLRRRVQARYRPGAADLHRVPERLRERVLQRLGGGAADVPGLHEGLRQSPVLRVQVPGVRAEARLRGLAPARGPAPGAAAVLQGRAGGGHAAAALHRRQLPAPAHLPAASRPSSGLQQREQRLQGRAEEEESLPGAGLRGGRPEAGGGAAEAAVDQQPGRGPQALHGCGLLRRAPCSARPGTPRPPPRPRHPPGARRPAAERTVPHGRAHVGRGHPRERALPQQGQGLGSLHHLVLQAQQQQPGVPRLRVRAEAPLVPQRGPRAVRALSVRGHGPGARAKRARLPGGEQRAAVLHDLPRTVRGHALRAVSLRPQPQVLLPLLQREHQGPGSLRGGVLPQRGEVPPGRLQRALGLHAGGDSHHPGRRREGEEGERPLRRTKRRHVVGLQPQNLLLCQWSVWMEISGRNRRQIMIRREQDPLEHLMWRRMWMRGDRYHQGVPSVSMATQPPEVTHLQSSANHSQAAVRRANEMLREMGRLKTEMKTLLTQPETSLKATRPPPDHHRSQKNLPHSQQNQSNQNQSHQNQAQQNQAQQNLPHSQQNQSHQNQSHQNQAQQNQAQQNLLQSQQNQSQPQQPQPYQNQSQPTHFESHQNQSQSQPNHFQPQQSQFEQNQSQSQQIQSQHKQTQFQSKSVLLQRRPVVPSMLEEAGQVLRQVQRQKKVLEENLEALLRAKTGEVLHCQLEALAANRDWTEEVRIKKTVDAWISTSSKDIQAETSSEDAAVTSQLRAAGSSTHSGRGRPVSALRGPGSKTAAGGGGRGPRARHRAVQGAEPGRVPGLPTDSEQVDGESYLAHLYGRAPYEGLRRTLKKSPYLRFSSPVSPPSRKPRPRLVESVRGVKVKSCKTQTSLAPPLIPSPGQPHHHLFISSSHMTSSDPADLTVTPADTHSVPMAIPLGRPRMDSSSRCLTDRQQEVTSPPSPVVTVVSGAPERRSQKEEQLDAGEAPLPPSHVVIETKSEEEEDEENVFPGTDFLSVADVVQEEVSVVGEEAVELDGGLSPPPVLYQGPVFPPQMRSALPAQGQAPILDTNHQRDALENRLVEWVEQQLMSRMISDMYHPPSSDPAQNISTDQSELEERSVTSDIVEAAGGAGLQLFVDSSVSVDSALIRQLVNEVLTEIVALMLGQRDARDPGPEPGLEPPKPVPAVHQEDKLVPLVPTPVPTPSPILTTPIGQTTPPTTPPPSEPTSLLNEESPQPITALELVTTPTPSPDPTPSAGSPPFLHQAQPALTWGDAELPLDEEGPEEHLDTHQRPLGMSVAEEEPPLSSPLPPPLPSLPPAPSPSPPRPDPDPRPASPSSSSGDSSSSSPSSSSTVTAALKHISEGELLISVNQLAATTGEEAVCSFSSSLQELQDMDYDPPSEGQVRGHNLLLTLLTKMEQGVTHRGERPQPEGSWGREDQDQEEEVSAGEVQDDGTTKPLRTTNPRSCSKSTAARQHQTSSPGQISQCADVSVVSFEATNQGSVTMSNLMMEPHGTLTSDLQSDLSLSPPPPHLENTHAAGQVVPRQSVYLGEVEGGSRRIDVHLPVIRPEEEVMEEVSAAADTDSSTNNVF